MSASAINPTPSAATGPNASSSASSGSAAGVQGGQGPQGHSALAGFEVMLETLFGVKTTAGAATATTGAKPATSGKTSTGDAAAGDKAAGDDKTAVADATATNPNLALVVPAIATPPAAATTPATAQQGAAQPALANVAAATGATLAPTGSAALAQLSGKAVAVDPNTDKGQKASAPTEPATALAAIAADNAAANANANAKAAPLAAPKTDAAPQVAQAPTPSAVPAAAAPAPAPVVEPPSAATAVVAPPPAPAAEKPAEPVAPVVAKERVQAIKASTRVDSVKTASTPGGIAALTAKAAEALQPVAGGAPKASLDDQPADQPLVETKTEAAATTTPAASDPATAATTGQAHLIHAAAVAVRGQPQTVANLAAQIVKKLDGRSSQFDLQLDPAGLGKVDVRIAIGADGRMSAAMSFDTPQAAAELKARAAELHQAMAQAGFDLTGGLSFDVASDRGQGQGNQAQNQQPEAGAAFRGRAFQAALDNSADVAPPQYSLRRSALAGVDIRI